MSTALFRVMNDDSFFDAISCASSNVDAVIEIVRIIAVSARFTFHLAVAMYVFMLSP